MPEQKFLTNLDVAGTVDLNNLTIDNAQGTDGQVLTSTGTGVAWEDAAAGTSETAERIEVTVKNVSGGSLSKGTVVHASPSATPPSGNVIEVIAADYDDSTKMPAIGILNETIADTAEGSAVMMGAVSGIDTSSFSIGDELYVGNLGALTNTKPTTAGQLIQKIAVVIKSHASNGLIKIFGAGRSNDVPLPLYIDNTNQRVGISEPSPAEKLVVSEVRTGSTASDLYTTVIKSVQSSGASPNPGTGGLKVQYTSSSSNVHAFGLVAGSSSSDFLTTGPMHFYTNSDLDTVSATGFAMQLDTSQRLILGSMTASQKLNVAGNVTADRYYGNSSTVYYVDPNDGTQSANLASKIRIGTGSLNLSSAPTWGVAQGNIFASTDSTNGGTATLMNVSSTYAGGDASGTLQFVIAGGNTSMTGGGYATAAITAISRNNPGSGTSGGGNLIFKTSVGYGSVSEKMRLTDAGRLGIGVDPSTKLHVDDGHLRIDNYGGTDNYYLEFYESGSQRFRIYENANNVYFDGGPGNTHFRPRQGGGSNNFIVTGANVGIGETNPGSPLHVAGDIQTASGSVKIVDNWGQGFYAAEQLSIVGSYPSLALRNNASNQDNKWLIHHDGNDLTFYAGADHTNTSWTKKVHVDSGNQGMGAQRFYDIDSTAYYVEPGSVSILNDLDLKNNGILKFYRAGGNALQRADARVENSTTARLHWYGSNDSGGNTAFQHAWYDGSNYINVTASNPGVITFAGSAASMYIGSDRVFDDGYHPNADKWTTARTVTFAGGDVSGSFSIDGSANVSNVNLTVANNSHTHVASDITSGTFNAARIAHNSFDIGDTTAETGRSVHETGIYTFNRNNGTLGTGTDSAYYSVLAFGQGTGGSVQIAGQWTSGGHKLYWRSLRDTTDNWWDWKEIYHTTHKPTYSELGTMAYSNLTGTPSSLPANGGNSDTVDNLHASSFLRSDTDDSVNAYTSQIRFPSNTSIESSGGNNASLEVYQGSAGNDAFMTFHVSNDFAAYFGLDGSTNDFAVGGWSMGSNKYKVWHAGNDGSGSGLNADYLDGLHAERFFRRTDKSSATVGPGWMTVAENVSGRRAGEIIVTDADSGDHAYIRIEWMRSYADSNFTVLNCGGHANRITGARVLYNTSDNTYGGKKLQVYVTTSSTYEVNIYEQADIDDYTGHSVVTPVIQNTISGYAVHGQQLENLDTFGFAAEEGILSGGDLKVLGSGNGIHVDSVGHASLRLDRGSTSYDNNLLFMTNGGIKWRLWQDGSDDYLYIRDDVNSNNLMTWRKGGSVGINTGTPNATLHLQVPTAAAPSIFLQAATNFAPGIYFDDSNTGTSAAGAITYATANNTFSIKANSTSVVTISSGTTTIAATADIVAYSSDKRLKENVQPIEKPLNKVLKLEGVTYNWNKKAEDVAGFDTEIKEVGLFAQDVQKVLPEAVKLAPFDTGEDFKSKSGEDYLTVQYEKIVPLLVEAIKDQQKQIDELKSIINGSP